MNRLVGTAFSFVLVQHMHHQTEFSIWVFVDCVLDDSAMFDPPADDNPAAGNIVRTMDPWSDSSSDDHELPPLKPIPMDVEMEIPMYVQNFLHCIMTLKCCNILIYFKKNHPTNHVGLCNKFCFWKGVLLKCYLEKTLSFNDKEKIQWHIIKKKCTYVQLNMSHSPPFACDQYVL